MNFHIATAAIDADVMILELPKMGSCDLIYEIEKGGKQALG